MQNSYRQRRCKFGKEGRKEETIKEGRKEETVKEGKTEEAIKAERERKGPLRVSGVFIFISHFHSPTFSSSPRWVQMHTRWLDLVFNGGLVWK
jgi:hypothetical protein